LPLHSLRVPIWRVMLPRGMWLGCGFIIGALMMGLLLW
jgi:hypothetical protein